MGSIELQRKEGKKFVVYHRSADVAGVIERLGFVDVKQSGNQLIFRCPNIEHRDKNPSFAISLLNGKFNCKGCHYAGNIVKLVMDLNKCNWHEAWNFISQSHRRKLAHVEYNKEQENKPVRVWPDSSLYLMDDKFDYLLSRGISAKTQKIWEVKHNDVDNRYALPYRHINNEIWGFITLADKKDRARGKMKVLYTKGFPIAQSLYGINRLEGDTVVLVEGAIDTLKVYDALQKSVVCAILGSSFNEMKMDMLLKKKVKYAYSLYDNDNGGKLACESTRKVFEGSSIKYKPLEYEGTDPGELTIKQIQSIFDY